MNEMGSMLLLLLVTLCSANGNIASSHCGPTRHEHGPHIRSVSITEFGGVGDGHTLNTKAFCKALQWLSPYSQTGRVKLMVPPGRWLTGSFPLISHLTLWLHRDAVLLASTVCFLLFFRRSHDMNVLCSPFLATLLTCMANSQNPDDWPIVDPLPSYGRGRELPGRRHQSLIYGHHLTDVAITGDNGTIEGQGRVWWDWFNNKTLNHTRPHLIEFINSTQLLISNLTLLNSPFWNIHPVYSSKLVVRNLTIRAPHDSPNTDGIDPDSCDDVCIEDCDISTGDDLVAIKSGWDEYGISFSRPCRNISIYRLRGQTQSSGITIGSEMSGGVSQVYVEDLHVYNTETAITLRTSPGRGGYIRDVCISKVYATDVTTAIWFNSRFGQHPDDHYDPRALPMVEKIAIRDVEAHNVKVAGLLEGIKGDDFMDICMYNLTIRATSTPSWNCSYVHGYSDLVSPPVCEPLRRTMLLKHDSYCSSFVPNCWKG